MADPIQATVLGVGEAGALIAAGLAEAGVGVRSYDPIATAPPGVTTCESAADAVAGTRVVLAMTGAQFARDSAAEAAPALGPGQIYADLSTAAPALMREVEAIVSPTGAAMCDVALMAPVPGRGLRTPAVASGPGAPAFAALLGSLGMPVEVVGSEVGAAAARKLLRSVYVKGLAAAVCEALDAAARLDLEGWLREDIAATLAAADVERMVTGSRRHAARRADEMDAAAELVGELGVEPVMARAAAAWHRRRGD